MAYAESDFAQLASLKSQPLIHMEPNTRGVHHRLGYDRMGYRQAHLTVCPSPSAAGVSWFYSSSQLEKIEVPGKFTRTIQMVQPGKWRAAAVFKVDNGDHTVEERIGPRICDTERAANEWLDAEAKQRSIEALPVPKSRSAYLCDWRRGSLRS